MAHPLVGWFALVAAFCLNAAANSMLKVASGRPVVPLSDGIVPFVRGNTMIGVALAAFAANVGFYYVALRSLPLSIAYPVMNGMTAGIVLVVATTVLGERITSIQILGIVLLVAGATLVAAWGK